MFNNVVRNVTGALGIAVLTAIWISQQAKQLAGRAALLPPTTATPRIGVPGVPDWISTYGLYRQTQLQIFALPRHRSW
ncbi:MAG: hypothetical protein M3Y48_11525 [Actinomycetota bacterium]|nr:hypothetical protein [Actinomycetota bacterium]